MKDQAAAATASPETVVVTTPLGRMRAGWQKAAEIDGVSGPVDTGRDSGVVQCRNIPYAEIPFRWAAPRRATTPWPDIRDGTVFGPGCPQSDRPLFDMDGIPLFGRPGPPTNTFPIAPARVDEWACLNLNVFAPATRRRADCEVQFLFSEKRPLPVMVWVHGGSYSVGAGSVGVYDGSNLVQLSMRMGTPVIVVTINYRLGVLGFLHSEQLQRDAREQQQQQRVSTGNLGLLDAQCAFAWVKDNIHHFGGDPNEITSVGESAGAEFAIEGVVNYLSVVPQLYIHIPRMILSSSTCLSIQLLRPREAQAGFDAICQNLGINPSDPEAVRQLRAIPVETLIAGSQVGSSAFRPVWDDLVITDDPRSVVFKPELWDPALRSLVLGTCQNEAWIREASTARPAHQRDFSQTISSRIPPEPSELRQRALRLYGHSEIFPWFETEQEPMSSPAAAAQRCSLAFDGHGRYYTPAALFSRSFMDGGTKHNGTTERSMFRYMFGYVTDHWQAPKASRPSKLQLATHTADLLPMFLHDSLSKEDRLVSETFAGCLVQFVSGATQQDQAVSLWQPYANEKYINNLDAQGNWTAVKEGPDLFDLTDKHLQFWKDVSKAIIATGNNGWPEMTR